MKTVLLIAGLLAAGWLIYNRRRVVAGIPVLRALVTSFGASGQPGELAPLIAVLYSSITDKSRRTWWTRTTHISGEGWTVVAAPGDAAVLAHSIGAVEADLNAALRDNAERHRIVIDAPLRIRGVVAKHEAAPGRPQLLQEGAVSEPRLPARPSRAETMSPSEGGSAVRSQTPRLGGKLESEAPTRLVATIGETFTAAPTSVRLWPIGPGAGQDPIVVPAGGIILGRSANLGVGRVASRTVSGRHAELRREGGAWVIRDLGSHNGTFLGARRVDQEKVRSGDVIGLGRHVRLRLVLDEQPLQSAARQSG